MLRKPEPGRWPALGREPGNGGPLLDDIEALGRGLSLTMGSVTPPKSLPTQERRSLSAGKSHCAEPCGKSWLRDQQRPATPVKKKKLWSSSSTSPSIWSWKPFRALFHIRHRRFDCLFTLQVHSIEGLPPSFHNAVLCVHWKRNASEVGLHTRAARVFQGAAEFEETLEHRCAVYSSRGGGSHPAAKYEAREFVLFPTVVEAPDVDLGEHRVDFTRLLPLTLEELEKETSGRWSTTFNLSGRARGASLNVSFGFSLLGRKDMAEPGGNCQAPELLLDGTADGVDRRSGLSRVGSNPAAYRESSGRLRLRSGSVEDIKVIHEVLTNPGSESVGLVAVGKLPLHRNSYKCELDDLMHGAKDAFKILPQHEKLPVLRSKALPEQMKVDAELDVPEFTVIEKGIEIVSKEGISIHGDLGEHVEPGKVGKGGKHGLEDDAAEDILVGERIVEELESSFKCLSIFESGGLEPSEAEVEVPEQLSHRKIKSDYKIGRANKSLSMDNVTESVATEFLSMLGIDHTPFGSGSDSDPESPRERLWEQFKRESITSRESIFGVCTQRGEALDWKSYNDDFDLSSVGRAAETEYQKTSPAMESKSRARMLEDAETEALMHEWGLSETAFQSSTPGSASGFGSPIELPPDDPLDLPSLGDGLGPSVQTRDGGFLRSMNPSLFVNSKNNGSLIMQVSCPVVVPAKMGSSTMEVLQHLASVGIEKLSMQANKVMPLEDITGKTMQQVAWEALPALEACERQAFFRHFKAEGEPGLGRNAAGNRKIGKISNPSSSDYVSLEDFAPLAMEKIEALSLDGLRIQSGMCLEDGTLSITLQSAAEVPGLEGKGAKNCRSFGLEGAAGLQPLDVKDGTEDVDGLLDLSITLDEWVKLDSGIIDEENRISDRTSRILAAHHANFADLVTGEWEGKGKCRKNSGKKSGLLGNNLTVALMVQLRDPLRNYEPVGSPMLGIILVKRVFIPSRGIVSGIGSSGQEEDPGLVLKSSKEEEEGEGEVVPQFKITEVHVAGLKTDPGRRNFWGNAMQHQSGSRWLVANGMGKSSKHPFLKSKAIMRPLQGTTQQLTATVQPGDTLWSISSHAQGTEPSGKIWLR